VRRGVFRRRRRDLSLVADANQVLFFNPGEEYRFGHPVAGGDDCTVIALDPGRARQLVERQDPEAAERPEAAFRVDAALSSPRAAWLQYELLARVRQGAPALAVEDVLAELAQDALASAHGRPGRGHAGRAAAARRRDMVEAAKVSLAERPDNPPSLGRLAQGFGTSPFHLSRTFRSVAGLSLRRYFGRLRARAAADRLAAGAADLTTLALDLGYADHSHLTNAFRREWGVPPSRFRARTSKPGRGLRP
jgi:AraC-like DNA-binding protein